MHLVVSFSCLSWSFAEDEKIREWTNRTVSEIKDEGESVKSGCGKEKEKL